MTQQFIFDYQTFYNYYTNQNPNIYLDSNPNTLQYYYKSFQNKNTPNYFTIESCFIK